MLYTRIFSTDKGETRMEELEADCDPVDFIPGQPALDLSPPRAARSVTFIRTPAGWKGGWHPTPRRQFVVGHSGRLEFRASDGQSRIVKPGDVVLLEDTTGKGHYTRVPGYRDWHGVLIALD